MKILKKILVTTEKWKLWQNKTTTQVTYAVIIPAIESLKRKTYSVSLLSLRVCARLLLLVIIIIILDEKLGNWNGGSFLFLFFIFF